MIATREDAFGREHEITYGHRAGPDEPVEIVTLQVVGEGIPEKPRVPETIRIPGGGPKADTHRRAYFGPRRGWMEVPVLSRTSLASPVDGPCIIEEYDATCVVPPDALEHLDGFGNIVLDLGPSG